MKLTNPPIFAGLGKTRSLDRRGMVPGTPSTRGLGQTVSIPAREKPAAEQAIREIGARAGALSAELGEVTAEGLIRFRSVAAASGAEASVALEVRASTAEAFAEAGIYLDANVTGLGGASRIRITADNIVISDGSDDLPAFEIELGVLYLREPVLVRGLDDDVVETSHVTANAITQLGNVLSTGTASVDSAETTIQTVVMTRNANSVLDINVYFEAVEFAGSALGFGTAPPVRVVVKLKRGGSTIATFNPAIPNIDAAGSAANHHYGGGVFIPFVDADNVSGSQTYTVTALFQSDLFGSPTAFDAAVRQRYLRLLERQR